MSLSFIQPSYLWLLMLLPPVFYIGIAALPAAGRLRRSIALALRILIMLLLILSLAGLQVRLESRKLTTVFVLDVSESLTASEKERGEDWIRQSVSEMKSGDQAAVIVFAEQALIERLASSEPQLDEIASIPTISRTDIDSALQLAFAIFPGEGSRRIVLLSDGRENLGHAIEQADYASMSQIELSYVPLGSDQPASEVFIDTLEAPSEIRQGQDLDLKAVLQSTSSNQASLRLFSDGNLVESREVSLLPGQNTVIFTIPGSKEEKGGGFRRFRVQVLSESDSNLQNNMANAYSVVKGPPNILIVEGQTGDGIFLGEALKKAGMNVLQVVVAEMPSSLSALADYDSLILVNVPASALPPGIMDTIEKLVRDLGKGFVMVGGVNAYGAGGYLRTPVERLLPVDMDLRDQEVQSNLALVLAVDKSGSMGRCHCDNPDLNQSYVPQQSGQAKVDIAKEAVMRAASALGDQDYLGVLAFDTQPRWAVQPTQGLDPYALEQAIVSIQAEGQTNLQAGVASAYQALDEIDARRKHIILLTDGWVHTGELHTLAQQMRSRGITLSIVAAGDGSALYLKEVASLGGGQYYPARNSLDVPDFFLKETIQSAGKYIVEGPFFPLQAAPSPVLRSLEADTFPYLLGYNGTSVKKTAHLDLITPQGDPLLATWQYGLGRTAAWTSDLKGQWAGSWVEWDGFARFAAQLVGWTIPVDHLEGLDFTAHIDENKAVVEVSAVRPDGSSWDYLSGSANIIDPQNETHEADLKQVSPGKYQITSDASTPGVYLIRIGINAGDQSLGQTTLGVVVPYSPEYKSMGLDRYLLENIASRTGGRALTNPEDAFLHTLVSIPSARELWLQLLILAAVLFPLEVALRRLSLQKSDLAEGMQKLRLSLRIRPSFTPQARETLFPNLFSARQRAREKQRPSADNETNAFGAPSKDKTMQPGSQVDLASEAGPRVSSSTEDRLKRLQEAKKRARR